MLVSVRKQAPLRMPCGPGRCTLLPMANQTEIVIHPVSPRGGRKVTVHALDVDTDLGRAFTPGDVSEFLRRAGMEDVVLS